MQLLRTPGGFSSLLLVQRFSHGVVSLLVLPCGWWDGR